jgi:hypothetical protein
MRMGAWNFVLCAASIASFVVLVRAQNGVAVCTTNADKSDITCKINQPVVDQRAQNGYRYNNVVFEPGDLVTVSANGCVQTGGTGATWKRYVDPSGPNSDHLYYGTIAIPGVIPLSSPVHIQRVQQFDIPEGVKAPDNVLVLGYKDDNYGDNGYWGHDNGTGDQCKGTEGDPASVVILIQHGMGKNLQPSGAPFDMIAGTVDSNDLPFNPEWQYEKNQTASLSLTTSHPDPSVLCDGFPYSGGNGHVSFGTSPCTSQGVTIDAPSGINDLLCGHYGTSGKLHGHVDWWPATVAGTIVWAGHDSTFSWSGGTYHFGDDDYNFELFPSDQTLLSIDPDQPANDTYIETEFDSDEVTDHFGSKWWSDFHDAVDKGGAYAGDNSKPTAPASLLINNKPAIVTGLVGLDSEHGAYTELHPVYAMAIHLNSDPNNDQWAFFARNWGDEGYCSQDQHYWDMSPVTIFIPEPVPSSDFSFVAQDLAVSSDSITVEAGKVDSGMVLTFALGTPESRALVDGAVTIRWTPEPSTGGTVKKPITTVRAFIRGPISDQAAKIAAAANAAKEIDTIDLPAPAASKQSALQTQLAKPAPAKNKKYGTVTRVTISKQPQETLLIARPKTRSVPDPVKAAKDLQRSQAICAAYDNNIPGIPGACKQ